MNTSVLFVAAEPGAARYFVPLWQRWLENPPLFSWQIILSDQAVCLPDIAAAVGNLPVAAIVDRSRGNIDPVVADVRPSMLISSAGAAHKIERDALALVQRSGGYTAQVIDTWYNYSRRFEGLAEDSLPESILVIDATAKAEAVEEGLPSERIVEVGQPWWENVPAWPGADRRRFLFLGAPTRRDYSSTLGYDEHDAWKLVLDAVGGNRDLCDDLAYGVHPEQDTPGTSYLGPARPISNCVSYIRQAGTVLGMFASPMIDAYLAGRSVVSVQPHPKPIDMCPLSRHGMVPKATTSKELVTFLSAPATTPVAMRASLTGSTDRLEKFIESRL